MVMSEPTFENPTSSSVDDQVHLAGLSGLAGRLTTY
jgi:hypothetical protein